MLNRMPECLVVVYVPAERCTYSLCYADTVDSREQSRGWFSTDDAIRVYLLSRKKKEKEGGG